MREHIPGGPTARRFLREHWQKRPLLVRGALPGLATLLDRAALARLAARRDVESRLVERRGSRWSVTHGPIARARLARAGARNWTLLVNGVNLHFAPAERLLRRFAFVPQARLDDVMVSYAAPGGGVGPHWDAYDVFLLQGAGRRIWRLARPRRFAAVPDAPLRLIAGFAAEDEYLVEPGDLLYLPPGWGHDGVALEAGFTWSVGFRAPGGAELASAFLDWLHARGLPEARYLDPDLAPAQRPARIPAPLAAYAQSIIARLRWRPRDVAEFLGEQLTLPKAHVVFARPARPLPQAAFAQRLARSEAVLDAKTQLLYRGARFFLNGEAFTPRPGERAALAALADARRIAGRRLARGARGARGALAWDWYRRGVLHLKPSRTKAR